jgi:carbamoyltransferase
MYILGISAYYHDSAAALIQDGEIIAAAQEERFTRKKNDESFPSNAIGYCLSEAGISIDDLEAIVFYEKPFLKFDRILQTFYEIAPRGMLQFLKAIPVWIKGKLFIKKEIREKLFDIQPFNKKKLSILFSEHHLSHAASAYYPSAYNEAAILTIDGVGEWATCTISHGEENKITIKKQINFPHSLGLLYAAFTYYCGFKVNQDEYKLMGLAAYGNDQDEEYNRIISSIEKNLLNISLDGSTALNQKYFNYTSGSRMTNDKEWQKLFDIKRRLADEPITQTYCNLALAIQRITEKIILLLVQEAKNITGSNNLCLAGGVALNCIANGKIISMEIFQHVFIQPASNDAGGALGAALAAYYIGFNKPLIKGKQNNDLMKGSLLGPSFTNNEIIYAAKKNNLKGLEINEANIYEKVAAIIEQGKVIAWFQGRTEFGPRALGNRSILADPRIVTMQNEINLKVKNREGFRPFAPIVLEEEASKYFDLKEPSPYMLVALPLRKEFQIPFPKEYDEWNMKQKLDYKKSFIPAVTHVDYTARLQTVDAKSNEKLYKLLAAFFQLTNCPFLINTSFNTNEEPIVNTADDAVKCFLSTNIDYLVMNNFIFSKQ